ncbi:hypothetical protein MRX96_015207 [Rhipicephalus microplus]
MPSSPPTVAPSSTSLRKSGPTSERKGRPEREAANNSYNNFPFPRLHFLVSLSSAQVQVYGAATERCGRRSDSSAAALVNSLARESECRRAASFLFRARRHAEAPELVFRQSCGECFFVQHLRATNESLAKQCRQEAAERHVRASCLCVLQVRPQLRKPNHSAAGVSP